MEGDSIGAEDQWNDDNLDFLLESIGNDLSLILSHSSLHFHPNSIPMIPHKRSNLMQNRDVW